MQITKETQRAHVILATSEYSFLTWLTESELASCLVDAMRLQQLTFLSHVELQEGFCTTEVIGDFPEPEARIYFQRLMMSKSREVTDKEWASVFEVRHSCSLLSSDMAQVLLEVVLAAALQVCGGNAGFLNITARFFRITGDVQAGWSLILAVHDVQH